MFAKSNFMVQSQFMANDLLAQAVGREQQDILNNYRMDNTNQLLAKSDLASNSIDTYQNPIALPSDISYTLGRGESMLTTGTPTLSVPLFTANSDGIQPLNNLGSMLENSWGK
jgi:hypothetical protein